MSIRRKTKTTTTTTSGERRELTKICAFWGLAIASTLFIVTAVLNIINSKFRIDGMGTAIGIFDVVAKVCLLVAIGIPAYGYVRRKSTGWKVFFWIALIIYALGVVFSVIHF